MGTFNSFELLYTYRLTNRNDKHYFIEDTLTSSKTTTSIDNTNLKFVSSRFPGNRGILLLAMIHVNGMQIRIPSWLNLIRCQKTRGVQPSATILRIQYNTCICTYVLYIIIIGRLQYRIMQYKILFSVHLAEYCAY